MPVFFFKDVAVKGINATVAIDNSGSLVTDTGEKRNAVCEWWTAGRFTLPGDTKVVTIKAHNDHGYVGGILALLAITWSQMNHGNAQT